MSVSKQLITVKSSTRVDSAQPNGNYGLTWAVTKAIPAKRRSTCASVADAFRQKLRVLAGKKTSYVVKSPAVTNTEIVPLAALEVAEDQDADMDDVESEESDDTDMVDAEVDEAGKPDKPQEPNESDNPDKDLYWTQYLSEADVAKVKQWQAEHVRLHRIVSALSARLEKLDDKQYLTVSPEKRRRIAINRSIIFERWQPVRKKLLRIELSLIKAEKLRLDRIKDDQEQALLQQRLAQGLTAYDHMRMLQEQQSRDRELCEHNHGVDAEDGACARCYTSMKGQVLCCRGCQLRACWRCLMKKDAEEEVEDMIEFDEVDEVDTDVVVPSPKATPAINTFAVPDDSDDDWSDISDDPCFQNQASLRFDRVAIKVPALAIVGWTAAQPTDSKIERPAACTDKTHGWTQMFGHIKCQTCEQLTINGGYRCLQCDFRICMACKIADFSESKKMTEQERLYFDEAPQEHYFSRTYVLPNEGLAAPKDAHAARSVAWWKKRLDEGPQQPWKPSEVELANATTGKLFLDV